MKRDNLELLAETCRDRKEVTKEGNSKGRCVTATILHTLLTNSHLAYDLAKQGDDIYNLLSAQEKSFQFDIQLPGINHESQPERTTLYYVIFRSGPALCFLHAFYEGITDKPCMDRIFIY